MENGYALGKPENRVSIPVGVEIFLFTTAFSPVQPTSYAIAVFSAIKQQGVIRLTHFHLVPKLKTYLPCVFMEQC